MTVDKKYFLVVIIGAMLFVIVNSQTTRLKPEYENILTEKGYHFRYKTEDSERVENGVIDETKGDNRIIVVSGSYSFTATNGNTYKVDFVADENGYRPSLTSEEANAFLRTQQNPPEQFRGPFRPYIG